MQGQTTWPCPHQLRKCPCQSSIWWQGCSFEQLQNSFSLSFCNCSMSFQHLKHLASACSAGTLECHRRSQIAVETLLATGHSKGWNGTLHRDAMTLALSSLVLPRLGSDMLLMLSISICKTRRWDLRMVALLIFVIFPLAQPSSKSSLLGESNGFECTMRFHSLCHVCLRMDPHLIQRVRYGNLIPTCCRGWMDYVCGGCTRGCTHWYIDISSSTGSCDIRPTELLRSS